MSGQTTRPLCFVDDQGGSLALLGAAIAHALGRTDAVAATLGDAAPVQEIAGTVLEEVGMTATTIVPFDNSLSSNHTIVWLGHEVAPATVASAHAWPAPAQVSPDAPLFDRLVMARIARDQFERRIKALGA